MRFTIAATFRAEPAFGLRITTVLAIFCSSGNRNRVFHCASRRNLALGRRNRARFVGQQFPAPHRPVFGVCNFADEFESAFLQDPCRCVVLGKSVGGDGANPSARSGEGDQLPGRVRGKAAVLITRSDTIGNLHHSIRARRAGKAAKADNGVVLVFENRKAVLPGISDSSSIQSFQEFRGYFRSRQKIPHALCHSYAKALFVDVSSLEKRAKVFRGLGEKADSLHHFSLGSSSWSKIRMIPSHNNGKAEAARCVRRDMCRKLGDGFDATLDKMGVSVRAGPGQQAEAGPAYQPAPVGAERTRQQSTRDSAERWNWRRLQNEMRQEQQDKGERDEHKESEPARHIRA